MYAADNLSAYGAFTHRHTGELLEQIGVDASPGIFTPHLLPSSHEISPPSMCIFTHRDAGEHRAVLTHNFFDGSPMVRLYDKSFPRPILGSHQLRGHRFSTGR